MQGLTCYRNRHPFEVSEIRQAQNARFMLNFEHHFLGLAVLGFPLLHLTLHGSEFVGRASGKCGIEYHTREEN